MNELQEYAIYLFACKHPFGVVKKRLEDRFKVVLNNKQLTAISDKHKEAIKELADNLIEQLRLAQEYGDLHLVNPIQRLILLQETALDIAKGEERINNEGKKTRLKNSNSAVAIDRLMKSIREEVTEIVGTNKEEDEPFRLVIDIVEPPTN